MRRRWFIVISSLRTCFWMKCIFVSSFMNRREISKWVTLAFQSPPIHSRHGSDCCGYTSLCSTWGCEGIELWFQSWCMVYGLYLLWDSDLDSTFYCLESIRSDRKGETRPVYETGIISWVDLRDDVNCSPDLRSLIQSMLEVDPRKRPSIEEILMRPCCLTRLHTLYPQYIPTLFPYTTPSFHPFTPSVSSHYSKRPNLSFWTHFYSFCSILF